ncbi:MAG TPA: hypothetical protein VFB49_06670 [Patescibacteria group bacterium]|nr:hypothetical protein [Patescibacteria group bacterium]
MRDAGLMSLPEARRGSPPARGARARVRPLADGDLPGVLALYERVFPNRPGRSPRETAGYFETILLRNPWADATLPSLVLEDGAGRVTGCLGVMPRRMWMGGRPVRAVVTHTFMVEPGSRAGLSALDLAGALLATRQDLLIAEGGLPSRLILERLGGSTALLYSLRWTRPLRPSRYLLSYLTRRGLPAVLSWPLRPACAAADAVLPLVLGGSLRPARSWMTSEDLDLDVLLQAMSESSSQRTLRPEYDRASLAWLLDLLATRTDRGRFLRVAVRDDRGDLAGWYLYYLNPGGISEVVQIGARKHSMGSVLDHLFQHARRGGSAAVSGQLEPDEFQAFAAHGCVFHHDGLSWFLIHSPHPDVAAAIHRGDARLTRLEGEWCIRP